MNCEAKTGQVICITATSLLLPLTKVIFPTAITKIIKFLKQAWQALLLFFIVSLQDGHLRCHNYKK